jgi:hypothetical protein
MPIDTAAAQPAVMPGCSITRRNEGRGCQSRNTKKANVQHARSGISFTPRLQIVIHHSRIR